MRFALDDSRRDFAASIDSMLAVADVPGVGRAYAAGDVSPLRTIWKSLADIGISGLLISEDQGGLDADPLDMVVALERLGAWAVPGPVVESIVAVPTLLRSATPAEPERREEWLTGLSAGDLVATLALEPVMPFALDPAAADVVLHAGPDAISLVSIDTVHDSIDPSRKLGKPAAGGSVVSTGEIGLALEAADLLASLACAAQLLGAGQALLGSTAEYAKSRRQFGKPIGSFQAIKHHLADVMIGLELARPLLYNAALSVASDSPHSRRDVSAAKVACGDAAYRASRIALQVHGAIGYTQEFDLAQWITKVRALQSAWGTAAVHRRRVLEGL